MHKICSLFNINYFTAALIDLISCRQLPLWERGKETEKQPVHISDVAAGIVAVVTNPDTIGQTYQFVGYVKQTVSVNFHIEINNFFCFRPKRYKLDELVKWFFNLASQGEEGMDYNISHIKYNPFFQWKVSLNEIIYNYYPIASLTWEILEKVSLLSQCIQLI